MFDSQREVSRIKGGTGRSPCQAARVPDGRGSTGRGGREALWTARSAAAHGRAPKRDAVATSRARRWLRNGPRRELPRHSASRCRSEQPNRPGGCVLPSGTLEPGRGPGRELPAHECRPARAEAARRGRSAGSRLLKPAVPADTPWQVPPRSSAADTRKPALAHRECRASAFRPQEAPRYGDRKARVAAASATSEAPPVPGSGGIAPQFTGPGAP